MDTLIIEGTSKTPKVIFDAEKGELLLEGRSIPENSLEFYIPLMEWLDTYSQEVKTDTIVHMKLEYFNTSSSKCILDFFRKLETISNRGNKISINWYFEEDDEDMMEAGEDYDAIVGLPFAIIEQKEA
ncbi:uncharacterized protein DUF1987 [Ancylomarina subtilis]|uniref:Uncharacterized protein DUF1987 n=1 Tax=Ancylomarina subtilis TaxID=1639035 RepID=A0A4Q7V5J3_9BACT|nr:DUF1987 domain-containing protein [Ancylomarina subtilis]RZT91806.1 uncharacterized protein DUF1987 [Ancylomarina subtilis]